MNSKYFSDIEDHFHHAIDLQQKWDFEEAKKQYISILEKDPENANAHHNIGVLYAVQLLEPEKSLPHFEIALNINPAKLQFWYSYLDALIKVGAADVAEHVLLLAINYGLNDIQAASLSRDIRLAKGSVKELIDRVLGAAPVLLIAKEKPKQIDVAVRQPSAHELQQLLSLFNQRKYAKASEKSKVLLKSYNKYVPLWNILAECEKRIGNEAAVLDAYANIANISPFDTSAQIIYAEALFASNELDRAKKIIVNILDYEPDCAQAHGLMGKIFLKDKDFQEALISFARALRDDINNPIFLEKFGSILRLQGDQDAALICFKAAVELSPDSAELQDTYGITLRNQERLAAAENAFRKALKINPGFTSALKNLCHLLEIHGRFKEAEAGLLKCIEIENESPESLFEVGRNLVQQKRSKEALDWLRRAVKTKPDYAAAHIALSAALSDAEEPDVAIKEVQESIEKLPDLPHLHLNLGVINLALSRADEAIACMRKALELNPEFSHARSSMLFALSHSTKISAKELYREHRIYGELIEKSVKGKVFNTYPNQRSIDRKLKIGFVSADFRNHAVAKFVMPFFEEMHKRQDFVTYAYSNHGAVDDAMLKIKSNFDFWRTVVQWSDDKLAEKIREDQIDILVDMNGHTAGDRLRVFARHPAPVQMTWIGYPGTTGLKAIDYILVEDSLMPGKNISSQFSENIIRLPRSSTFDGKSHLKPNGEAPCLKNGFITLGSFNRLNKINREVVELWSRVLNSIPNSKLLMAGMPASGAPKEVLNWFEEFGVEEDRVYFYPRSSFDEYLKLHNQVDFCLDTFPYTGGTTSLHALWMGVPTLTLSGETYQSNQTSLIVSLVGLQDYFIANNKDDFLKKALAISKNINFINFLRCEIRNHLDLNYDKNLNAVINGCSEAFRRSWIKWCSGQAASNITIKADEIQFENSFANYENYLSDWVD